MFFAGMALGAMAGAAFGIGVMCCVVAGKREDQQMEQMRMKDCVMGTVTTVQENAADILASAKDINQERAAREEIVEDAAEETQAAPEA